MAKKLRKVKECAKVRTVEEWHAKTFTETCPGLTTGRTSLTPQAREHLLKSMFLLCEVMVLHTVTQLSTTQTTQEAAMHMGNFSQVKWLCCIKGEALRRCWEMIHYSQIIQQGIKHLP